MSFGVTDLCVAGRLRSVSLNVGRGSVAAVVGGDGAGKTTLLRVVAGGSRPTRGRVNRPPPERIGYVPTGTGTYPDLTVSENLDFAAAAYGVRGSRLRSRRAELLGRTELSGHLDHLAGQLSGGQRQKLGLAAALLHEPELLVLDEPTTGLDPLSRTEVWRLVVAAAAAGAAVLFASSYLDDAERAEEVTVLHEGSCLMQGSPRSLAATMPGRVVEVDEPLDRAYAWRSGRGWRQWIPDDTDAPGPAVPASVSADELATLFEDAVLVATLRAAEASER